MNLTGLDAWLTREPEPTREDAEMALRDWYDKHYRVLEDTYDKRLAELDAWFAEQVNDLETEYKEELDRL